MKEDVLEKKVNIHNWVGVVSPLVFFLHSANPGFGLLIVLTVIFFINYSFGLLNLIDSLKQHVRILRIGIAFHILFSVTLLMLTFLHI